MRSSEGLRKWLILGLLALIVWPFVCVVATVEWVRLPFRRSIAKVEIGDERADVERKLGPPMRACSCAEGGCFESGYERPERCDATEMLVYLRADLVFYVFLDQDGKVVATFLGGS